MAAPNIVNVTSILGKSLLEDGLTTGPVQWITNAAGSNKVLKINSVVAFNVDGTNDSTVTAWIQGIGAGNQLQFDLAKEIPVEAKTSLVLISRDTPFYMQEGTQFVAKSSTNFDVSLIISYEEIDDA